MFSGIIRTFAEVKHCEYKQVDGAKILCGFSLVVDDAEHVSDIFGGASCAVNGVCLTLREDYYRDCGELWFALSTATLALSTLGDLGPATQVHFERSLKFGAENGGHILSGHVDGTVRLLDVYPGKLDDLMLTWSVSAHLAQYMVEGGYVALAGTSLTLRDLRIYQDGTATFTVNLIGETLKHTIFSQLQRDTWVNVEVDYQTKVIIQAVNRALQGHRLIQSM